jgi:hypothetical protein
MNGIVTQGIDSEKRTPKIGPSVDGGFASSKRGGADRMSKKPTQRLDFGSKGGRVGGFAK